MTDQGRETYVSDTETVYPQSVKETITFTVPTISHSPHTLGQLPSLSIAKEGKGVEGWDRQAGTGGGL